MIIGVDTFDGQDVMIIEDGLMIWDGVDNCKRYFGYLTRSHYYSIRHISSFINRVKRK